MKLIAITILLYAGGLLGAVEPESDSLLVAFNKAVNAQVEEQHEAYNKLAGLRQELARSIVSILTSPQSSDIQRECAIGAAGIFRVSETTDLLIPRMNVVTVLPLTERTLKSVYPAMASLISIETDVPEKVLVAYSEVGDETTKMLVAYILLQIDGLEIGKARLNMHIVAEVKTKHPGRVAVLRDILIQLERLVEQKPPPEK